MTRQTPTEIAALNAAADRAWARVAEEFIAESSKKPTWIGQPGAWRDQGSNYNPAGWGR